MTNNKSSNVISMNKKQMQDIEKLIVHETTLTRAALQNKIGQMFDGKRDFYSVFGYKKNPVYRDFLQKFQHQDLAKRIIAAFPDAVWKKKPEVSEDEDSTEKSEFEKAFDDICKKTKLFHYLNRADKLSRIGRYSVLLLGCAGSDGFDKPLKKLTKPEDLLYLMPFSEDSAKINTYVTNEKDPRYGMPETYTLTLGGIDATDTSSKAAVPQKSMTVHHSRLIHIAGGLLENDIFGTPQLESIYNLLDDLLKVVGGASEIFWLNGRGGLHLNAPSDTQIADKEKLAAEAENYIHQISRVLKTKGLEVNTLQMDVKSPKDHFTMLIDLISGTTGIPKRILLGSERGELASTQDQGNWLTRVEEEKDMFCEPQILRPVIDKFIEIGVLPESEEYQVVWPDLQSASEAEKADIAVKRSQAISTYANSVGADMLITPQQFVEDIMDMEYREDDIDDMIEEEVDDIAEDESSPESNPDEDQSQKPQR